MMDDICAIALTQETPVVEIDAKAVEILMEESNKIEVSNSSEIPMKSMTNSLLKLSVKIPFLEKNVRRIGNPFE